MSAFLDESELSQLKSAVDAFRSPIPTQLVSNEEMMPLPQSAKQREVEKRIKSIADDLSPSHALDRRRFLSAPAGMAAAFIAMNSVYGSFFDVDRAEAAVPGMATERARNLSDQFIFDPHTHYVREELGDDHVLSVFAMLRNMSGKMGWNPKLAERLQTMNDLRLQTFVREIFLDSDTKVAVLSGAPADEEKDWMLPNPEIARTRDLVNRFAGSQRLLSQFIIAPGHPGWLDDLDRGIAELKPSSIKGYTIGDDKRKEAARYPWRLDDEKLVYPAYERMLKAGIRNIAVHKGLFTQSDLRRYPNLVQHAAVGDVGQAAKDWPQLNFIIYHSGYRLIDKGEPEIAAKQFDETGRIDWVTDLAEIPSKYGVSNVYGEIGSVFALTCISAPRAAAAMIGTLVKGLGEDHLLWGTDSIWFGSPQWQIEAMRRLEIPEDMQRKHGFAPLGPADGPVKRKIFGLNGAKLFGINPKDRHWAFDDMSRYKQAYMEAGIDRTNRLYGSIRA